MGKRNLTSPEEASSIITGSFSATGSSPGAAFFKGGINIALWGTFVATVQVERSFDGGANFMPVERDTNGTNLTFSSPDSVIAEEVESAVIWRLTCTNYTSGQVNYRVSQG